MAFNDLLKLDLPDDFPAHNYSEFMAAARAVLLPNKVEAWKEFAGASNLIGWRFRASSEDMKTYIASWQQYVLTPVLTAKLAAAHHEDSIVGSPGSFIPSISKPITGGKHE